MTDTGNDGRTQKRCAGAESQILSAPDSFLHKVVRELQILNIRGRASVWTAPMLPLISLSFVWLPSTSMYDLEKCLTIGLTEGLLEPAAALEFAALHSALATFRILYSLLVVGIAVWLGIRCRWNHRALLTKVLESKLMTRFLDGSLDVDSVREHLRPRWRLGITSESVTESQKVHSLLRNLDWFLGGKLPIWGIGEICIVVMVCLLVLAGWLISSDPATQLYGNPFGNRICFDAYMLRVKVFALNFGIISAVNTLLAISISQFTWHFSRAGILLKALRQEQGEDTTSSA